MKNRWQQTAQRVFIACFLALTMGALAAPKNLLENPGFEDGVADPWTFYGQVVLSLSKKADAHSGSKALFVQVNAVGANFWDSGVQYKKDIVFNKNTQYTWAMFFRSEKDRRINMKAELSVDPWTAYAERQMNVTPEWQEFYLEYKPSVDVVPASLTLHVAETTVSFWMDDVRWYEGAYEPSSGVSQAVEPTGKMVLAWAQLKQQR